MEHSVNLHYLYCMNMNCRASIYHRMITNVACDAKNLFDKHRCVFCDQLMTSGSDLVLSLMVAAVSNQRNTRLSYLHN